MASKLGHFKVVNSQAHLLVLERRSELPLIALLLSLVLLIVLWFLKPWQSASGLVVSLAFLVLVGPGIVAALYLRPWKEVLIFDRHQGHMQREERHLLRPNRITRLPLDSVAEVHWARRKVRVMDRKGEMVEHAYWAALLRTVSDEEIELDGANDPEKTEELVKSLTQFLDRPALPAP